MELNSLVVRLVEVWEGAVDGHVRAGPEEGGRLLFLPHGREPNLRRRGGKKCGRQRRERPKVEGSRKNRRNEGKLIKVVKKLFHLVNQPKG